jgi:hypothetical protein
MENKLYSGLTIFPKPYSCCEANEEGNNLKGPVSWNGLTDKPFYEKSEVVTETTTIEWDGIAGDRVVATGATILGSMPVDYVRISDGVIMTAEDLLAGSYMGFIGSPDELSLDSILSPELTFVENGSIVALNSGIVSVFEDNTIVELPAVDSYTPVGTVLFPKKGIYSILLVLEDVPAWYLTKVTAKMTLTKTEIKKIDSKFLPETFEPKELILTSSTAGSTKKFKITVADDGTMTAIEVM